ncbi:hypothetical protein C7974DRAFT_148599 [Boeremia exigua]|uniref:uncharacterized protein n=1 Tax=Boeremia exigua TaxID=749465 RepID=UPI001E8D7B74|nr:uncharacterized protein C7974DRAFT_148599 [Boeremia exigua]KAH6637795.1 hypothetical protein C7974DRAFT_148599 [Boeremia exigua]
MRTLPVAGRLTPPDTAQPVPKRTARHPSGHTPPAPATNPRSLDAQLPRPPAPTTTRDNGPGHAIVAAASRRQTHTQRTRTQRTPDPSRLREHTPGPHPTRPARHGTVLHRRSRILTSGPADAAAARPSLGSASPPTGATRNTQVLHGTRAKPLFSPCEKQCAIAHARQARPRSQTCLNRGIRGAARGGVHYSGLAGRRCVSHLGATYALWGPRNAQGPWRCGGLAGRETQSALAITEIAGVWRRRGECGVMS